MLRQDGEGRATIAGDRRTAAAHRDHHRTAVRADGDLGLACAGDDRDLLLPAGEAVARGLLSWGGTGRRAREDEARDGRSAHDPQTTRRRRTCHRRRKRTVAVAKYPADPSPARRAAGVSCWSACGGPRLTLNVRRPSSSGVTVCVPSGVTTPTASRPLKYGGDVTRVVPEPTSVRPRRPASRIRRNSSARAGSAATVQPQTENCGSIDS